MAVGRAQPQASPADSCYGDPALETEPSTQLTYLQVLESDYCPYPTDGVPCPAICAEAVQKVWPHGMCMRMPDATREALSQVAILHILYVYLLYR